MKKLLLTFAKHSLTAITLVMLVAGSYMPLVALADTPVAGDANDSRNIPAASNPNSGFGNLSPEVTAAAAAGGGTGGTAATPANQQNVGVSNSDIGCNASTLGAALTPGTGTTVGGTFALCLTNIVYVFTVGIGSGFAYISAYFFDWAISLSLNGTAYALTFVSQGWTTARDLANMTFLFILIYIAFVIIFEADTSNTIHMLVTVIIVALLVNFSFFFTRLAIDAGNILAIQFYNAIPAPSVGATAAGNGVQATVANVSNVTGSSFSNSKDLTSSIMGMLQLQNLFSTNSFQTFFKGNDATAAGAGFLVTTIALTFLYISAAIMFWLLTVAFVTNGIKFLVRIVVLWFLIIASPLAFVARAIPRFKSYYDEWQDSLIKHAFYPVAFMFIFLILTNFANQMGGQNGLINGIFNSLSSANNSNTVVASIGFAVANVGIRMGFVIAILYIGLKASDRIGVMGASAAKSVGSWVGTGMLKAYNVPYKRVGPGAWAGGFDRSLEKGALARIGNTALGYELRRYVTKPLAKTTVPGSHGESYTELKDRQKKEGAEMGTNLQNIKNKNDLQRLAVAENSFKPLEQKDKDYKELKKLQDQGTEFAALSSNPARTAAEETTYNQLLAKGPAGLSVDEINRRDELLAKGAAPLNATEQKRKDELEVEKHTIEARTKNFGKTEIEAIKAEDLVSIARVLTESQIKIIRESDKFKQADKDKVSKKWEEESPAAAYKQANTIIKELRDINGTLGNLTPINDAIKKNSVVDEESIKKMKRTLENRLINVDKERADENKKARPLRDTTKLAQLDVQRRAIGDAKDAVKRIDEARKKVGPDLDSGRKQGVFSINV